MSEDCLPQEYDRRGSPEWIYAVFQIEDTLRAQAPLKQQRKNLHFFESFDT